jgi:hypothetical protein
MSHPVATVKFPDELNTMFPIEIADPATGLEAGFVQRYSIEELPEWWKNEELNGVYILLSDLQFTNSFRAYVGATFDGFDEVLQLRNAKVRFWSNAIMFASPTLTPDDTAQVEVLINKLLHTGFHIKTESDLDELETDEHPDYSIENVHQIPQHIRDMALFIVRVLFLKGYRSASLAKAVHAIEPTFIQD